MNALIAEDEPLLSQSLRQELQLLWPELRIVASAGDGVSALQSALALLPDVVFLDIHMPGLSGLEVAEALAEDWPDGRPLPRIVFVTAYDQYALQAFDAQAMDYLLKPVRRERLARTVERLQQALPSQLDMAHSALALHTSLSCIAKTLEAQPAQTQRLEVIQASVGAVLHRVPVADVLFLSAADKYVRVVTAQREYLIRTPVKILLRQLDPSRFWQIHRSTLVQAAAIASTSRDAQGKVWLRLHGHPQALVVSRLHTGLFKAM